MRFLNRLLAGFTSADFPGVSPRTRHGSFVNTPGYVMPWPSLAGTSQNYFRPLDAGMLRLPQLYVSTPNQVSPSAQATAATPAIRRQRTGATIYYG